MLSDSDYCLLPIAYPEPHAYFPYTLSINPSFSSSPTTLSSIRLSTVTWLPGVYFNASSSWIFMPSRVVYETHSRIFTVES